MKIPDSFEVFCYFSSFAQNKKDTIEEKCHLPIFVYLITFNESDFLKFSLQLTSKTTVYIWQPEKGK